MFICILQKKKRRLNKVYTYVLLYILIVKMKISEALMQGDIPYGSTRLLQLVVGCSKLSPPQY